MEYSNVHDVAVIHVAAILDPDVKYERIFAWSIPFNWNDVLTIMRKLRPGHKFVDDLPDMEKLSITVNDHGSALMLLKKWTGQDGWTPLEKGIQDNLAGLE